MMSSRPKEKTALPNGVDNRKETIITGRVLDYSGQPVGRTAVRLLNACNESPGRSLPRPPVTSGYSLRCEAWTVHALCPNGCGDVVVAPPARGSSG
jgi:hypothetical protein